MLLLLHVVPGQHSVGKPPKELINVWQIIDAFRIVFVLRQGSFGEPRWTLHISTCDLTPKIWRFLQVFITRASFLLVSTTLGRIPSLVSSSDRSNLGWCVVLGVPHLACCFHWRQPLPHSALWRSYQSANWYCLPSVLVVVMLDAGKKPMGRPRLSLRTVLVYSTSRNVNENLFSFYKVKL